MVLPRGQQRRGAARSVGRDVGSKKTLRSRRRRRAHNRGRLVMKRVWPPITLVALYVLAVGVGGYVVVPRLPWYLPNQEATAWQTWAVLVGGAVVLWYTWETTALRRAAERQVEAMLHQTEGARRQAEAAQ